MPDGLTQVRPRFTAMRPPVADFAETLRRFSLDGTPTEAFESDGLRYFVNAFWTAQQRRGHSLHEVSYRACFKPQLPEFFIARLTAQGDTVYDPFAGRGTTPVQAALMGRRPVANDVSPLTAMLVAPRLDPPSLAAIGARLAEIGSGQAAGGTDKAGGGTGRAPGRADTAAGGIDQADGGTDPATHGIDTTDGTGKTPDEPDLSVFYHPDTLRQIRRLRGWLLARAATGRLDAVDGWIRMVAINRLTGHSPGFFSVYTMPPNQAVSVESQRKINALRHQVPPPRDIAALILKKSRALLADGCPPSHPPA